MLALQAEQRPRSHSQLIKGMFSCQEIACPHEGQREGGADSVSGGASSMATPSRSALSCFQPRSRMSGMRWMTTLRKLPMQRPKRARTNGERKISAESIGPSPPSDHLAQLEDRQVHGNDDAADEGAEDDDDERLHQARQALHRLVNLVFVELGGL